MKCIIDYCRFINWGYRKRTAIWGCVHGLKSHKCLGPGKCKSMKDGHHIINPGGGGTKTKYPTQINTKMKARIPPKLIDYLLKGNDLGFRV